MPGSATPARPSVIDDKGDVRGVDWGFNAWGAASGGLYFPSSATTRWHARSSRSNGAPATAPTTSSLEGGSIHVDGEGTLITTEECLLNHNRNPHLSQAEIERTLRDYLAVGEHHLAAERPLQTDGPRRQLLLPCVPARCCWSDR